MSSKAKTLKSVAVRKRKRLMKLKAQIKKGTYHVSSSELARALAVP